MAALVLKMSMSLDGFVGTTTDRAGWNAAGSSSDSLAWLVDQVGSSRANLMGATTYDVMASHWPTAPGPVAEAMNRVPKVVFSSSLTSAPWGPTTIARGDLAEEITSLKAEHDDGELLALGGAAFGRSLVATGLVDVYRLAVHPVVLGSGERLFTSPLGLTQTAATTFSGGIVVHEFTASG